jgi:hypothetical protein
MAVSLNAICLRLADWIEEAVQHIPNAVVLALASLPPYMPDEAMLDLLEDEPYAFMLWMSDW